MTKFATLLFFSSLCIRTILGQGITAQKPLSAIESEYNAQIAEVTASADAILLCALTPDVGDGTRQFGLLSDRRKVGEVTSKLRVKFDRPLSDRGTRLVRILSLPELVLIFFKDGRQLGEIEIRDSRWLRSDALTHAEDVPCDPHGIAELVAVAQHLIPSWAPASKKANKSVESTPTAVTPAADAPGAPSAGVPHH